MSSNKEDYGLTAEQLKLKYGAAGHPYYTKQLHWVGELLGVKLSSTSGPDVRYWGDVVDQLKHESFMSNVRASMEPKAVERLRDAIAPEVKLDSTHSTSVDPDYFWRPMRTCPRGCKVQLLGEGGVAAYGSWNGSDPWWRGWAPLPKINEELLK